HKTNWRLEDFETFNAPDARPPIFPYLFNSMRRRTFLRNSSVASAGLLMTQPAFSTSMARKKKLAIVGTGIRGTGFWAAAVKRDFGDLIDIVALCDINPGRLEWSKQK